MSGGVGAVRRCPPQGYRMGGLQVATLSCVRAVSSSTSMSSSLAESPAWSWRVLGRACGLGGQDPAGWEGQPCSVPAPRAELTLRSAHRGDRVDDATSSLLSPEPWAWGFSQRERQADTAWWQTALLCSPGRIGPDVGLMALKHIQRAKGVSSGHKGATLSNRM